MFCSVGCHLALPISSKNCTCAMKTGLSWPARMILKKHITFPHMEFLQVKEHQISSGNFSNRKCCRSTAHDFRHVWKNRTKSLKQIFPRLSREMPEPEMYSSNVGRITSCNRVFSKFAKTLDPIALHSRCFRSVGKQLKLTCSLSNTRTKCSVQCILGIAFFAP